MCGGKDVRATPHLKDSANKAIDLLTGKSTARGFFEGGHQFAGHAFCYNAPQRGFARYCEIYGIRQRHRHAVFPVLAVAACAVLLIESGKIHHLIRTRNFGAGSPDARAHPHSRRTLNRK